MPIVVQEDSWEQTLTQMIIYLPLKNIARKCVDVFSTPNYLKVSYPPFLFEKSLFAEIKDRDSSTEITSSQIVLKLTKLYSAIWETVGHAQTDDRAVMRVVRQEALDFSLQRSRTDEEQRKAAKLEAHKFAVTEHMSAEAESIREVTVQREREKSAVLAGFDLTDGRGDKPGISRADNLDSETDT